MPTNLKRILIITLLTALILPFQNCSSAKFGANTQKPPTLSNPANSDGNGTGYGGKVYVSSLLNGDLCDDGTPEYGRFVTIDAVSATLQRISCGDVSPSPISLVEPGGSYHYSELSENPYDLYVFRDRLFETDPPVPAPWPIKTVFACVGQASGGEVKIVVRELTGGQYIATLKHQGAETLLTNLTILTTGAQGKTLTGFDANATYSLDASYIDIHSSSATYNSAALNVITTQLSCYRHNYP